MTWYEDLSRCDYFRRPDSALSAVGWLERGRPFPTGSVPVSDFARLVDMVASAWEPFIFLGWHDCDLCDEVRGPTRFEFEGRRVDIGTRNIFLPVTGECVLVAPSMILHYIDVHGYRPPDEFFKAMHECPPMGSEAYLRAIGETCSGLFRRSSPG